MGPGSTPNLSFDSGRRDEAGISPLSLIALYVFLTLLVYIIAVYRRGKHRGAEGGRSAEGRVRGSEHSRTVLIVIAHPDDECLFFAPSILTLNSTVRTDVHVLCLSTGDYYGEGEKREKELVESCAILGVPPSHVVILDESDIQDDPDVMWDYDVLGKHIVRQIIKCDAQMVITFDGRGITGHPNHISAYRSMRKLVQEHKLPRGVRAYCLETVTVLRQFVSFLEVPISFVLSAMRGSKVLVSSPNGVWRAQKAMKAHSSQFVWFRILNIMFSRYLIINTIKTITMKSPP